MSNEQVDDDRGGYYHVLQPADPEQVADEIQRMLNKWYAKAGQLIQRFADTYDDIDCPNLLRRQPESDITAYLRMLYVR